MKTRLDRIAELLLAEEEPPSEIKPDAAPASRKIGAGRGPSKSARRAGPGASSGS